MLGHWLRDETIQQRLTEVNFHVTCAASVNLGQYAKSSVRTMTPQEAESHNMSPTRFQVACSYNRTGRSIGQGYKIINIHDLDVDQPANKSTAMIVKDPGRTKLTDESNKRLFTHVEGARFIGEKVFFLKKEKRERNDPSPTAPEVACLKTICDFEGLSEGARFRVPIDCVCKMVFAKK